MASDSHWRVIIKGLDESGAISIPTFPRQASSIFLLAMQARLHDMRQQQEVYARWHKTGCMAVSAAFWEAWRFSKANGPTWVTVWFRPIDRKSLTRRLHSITNPKPEDKKRIRGFLGTVLKYTASGLIFYTVASFAAGRGNQLQSEASQFGVSPPFPPLPSRGKGALPLPKAGRPLKRLVHSGGMLSS